LSRHDDWLVLLKRALNEAMPDPAEVQNQTYLYHYSPMPGIEGILSSQSIWISDIRSLWTKDPKDGVHWIDIFRSILEQQRVPKYVRDEFNRRDRLLPGSRWHQFVACFSSDSRLHHQWTNYAADGTGCAVEIEFEKFRNRAREGNAYGWTPILYDCERQLATAKNLVRAVRRVCREQKLAGEVEKDFWRDAAWIFLCCGTAFKDPVLSPESEWRLFLGRNTLDDASLNARNVHYHPFPLSPDLVTGLVRGPRCGLLKEELERLMSSSGYRPVVREVLE
jgi:hypothetical protein